MAKIGAIEAHLDGYLDERLAAMSHRADLLGEAMIAIKRDADGISSALERIYRLDEDMEVMFDAEHEASTAAFELRKRFISLDQRFECERESYEMVLERHRHGAKALRDAIDEVSSRVACLALKTPKT